MRMTRLMKCRRQRSRTYRKVFLLGIFLPFMVAAVSYLAATLFILPMLSK